MKKGYTLIEVIVTLSILIILISIVSLGANYYKKTTDKIKSEAILAEVKEFLSFAKSYCREKNIEGKILIDSNGEYMKFSSLTKEIKSLNFYDDFTVGGNFGNGIIDLNRNGFITKFGTISIYKNGKYMGVITIAVSIDTIRVHETDKINIITVYETDEIVIYKGIKEDEKQ